jgi:hypothetical protein
VRGLSGGSHSRTLTLREEDPYRRDDALRAHVLIPACKAGSLGFTREVGGPLSGDGFD